MDFYDVLDKVQALLTQRGRVSYRALRLQFHLDDETLDALKEELIEVHHLAVDQDGRMLVWTGAAQPTLGAPSPPSPHQAIQHEDHPLPLAPPTTVPPPEAERRQLTVMFCDLVDSTKLSSQLDPEDWRDVVRAYQRVCTDVIQRYDGHIAQLLGDGLLIYFGYPQAHEDDAQRAIRTGLGILDAMEDLNQRLQQAKGIQLAIRIGVNTGLVVIGEMGGAGRQEQLALGETPNIAARIQGLAQPNTVAISEATYRLIQGYFDCEALGAQALRGVAEPVAVYRVLQESGARGRLDVAVTRGLTPLVGRESEVTLLLERWAQVKAGHGHVVLLTGDARIGKSRLVQMLKDHVANEPHVHWECRSAEYSQNTALFPLVELFQRILRFEPQETPEAKLEKLEHALSQYRLPVEESVRLFAPLLSLPLPEDRYAFLALSPQRQRQKTLEMLVALLLELAEQHPVLFILEDLHWTDPTTLEWLHLLIDQTPTASILVLLTCRSHFQPAWHHRSYLTEITVKRLSHAQVEQIVNCLTDGKILPPEVLAQIVERTDGVPLFVEELTKAVVESGYLQDVHGHYELTGALSTLAIPATLQDSLMARLDRLVTAKAVAQYAAVLGRQFPYELLQAVSQLDASTLQRELGRLVEAEIIYQRGLLPQAYYFFKHALIQDAAYQSLLKSTRQHYHQRIALVLEAQFPETTEEQPELLAHHYTEAGLIEQAVGYWQKAGQRAAERSAHVEAISHLTTGLPLLQTLPNTPHRMHQELDFQTLLGTALLATRGYAAPEVEAVYERARALCQHVGETPQLTKVLVGLFLFYVNRPNFHTSHELGEQLLRLAHQSGDPTRLLQAHMVQGVTVFWTGHLAQAWHALEQGIALYDALHHHLMAVDYGQDSGVVCRHYAGWVRWCLGYPDQARTITNAMLTLAQELAHPLSLVYALSAASALHNRLREGRTAHQLAEAACALAAEHGFTYWVAQATTHRGVALVTQGQSEEGIVLIQRGITARRATGAELGRSWHSASLAKAYGTAGQVHKGLSALAEGLAWIENTGERSCEAELHRLKGELLLQQSVSNQTEAESCFHHAIDIARNQQAKSWELRATTSLARLWQQQGKRQEAYDLLAPVYNWFTEGFDTADLKDAKALLNELSERVGDGLLRGGGTGPRIAPTPRACVLPCPETTI
jgi:class 3 adenylate cyclase/predicted ATPase